MDRSDEERPAAAAAPIVPEAVMEASLPAPLSAAKPVALAITFAVVSLTARPAVSLDRSVAGRPAAAAAPIVPDALIEVSLPALLSVTRPVALATTLAAVSLTASPALSLTTSADGRLTASAALSVPVAVMDFSLPAALRVTKLVEKI